VAGPCGDPSPLGGREISRGDNSNLRPRGVLTEVSLVARHR
jgi:hypothetical protein